jgi:hypothetical protein
MKIAAVLASGPSMSQAIADSVRGRCIVIAVSDVYTLAPWADALVSNDSKWWRYHKPALRFAGRRFCGARYPGTEWLSPSAGHNSTSNSGLQGMRVARDKFLVEKILLLGFDLHGSHFFGLHPLPLKNTSPQRRLVHIKQFERFDTKNCRVVNCTQGSMLKCFPFGDLETELLEMAA